MTRYEQPAVILFNFNVRLEPFLVENYWKNLQTSCLCEMNLVVILPIFWANFSQWFKNTTNAFTKFGRQFFVL